MVHATRTRVALAISLVGVFNAATIVLMYTVAGFFGPLNDLGVGAAGVLVAVLAWQLAPLSRSRAPFLTRIGLITATAGAAVVVLGSLLVVSGRTGWFLAGHVTMVGFAGLGPWIIGINRLARNDALWPPQVTTLGLTAGVLMLCGFFAAPAIVTGLDDPLAAPWYVMLGYTGGAGWFLVLPLWAWRLARFDVSEESREQSPARA